MVLSKASSNNFYMRNRWAKQSRFLLICLFAFACGEDAAVDESYLDSEAYSEFSEHQQEEYAAQIKNYNSLQKYLAAYARCPMGKEWAFPLQIDADTFDEYGGECEEIAAKFDRNYSARNIGYSRFQDFVIRWLVLQKESVYEDSELLAATYRDDALASFQSIGLLRENLSEDISTRVEADLQDQFVDISSYKNRGMRYPFRYDNVIESTYRIDTSGVIRKQAAQTRTYNSLPDYLAKFNECELGKKWHFPMQIHTESLENYGRECGIFTDKLNPNFSARTIGYSQFNELIIRWIDFKENSFSEDRRLMAAVFQNDSLISFQNVGVFRKHSSRHITTGIEVSQEDDLVYISSAMKRSVKFPIKHENIVESVYEIDSLGTIRQHQ